MTTMVIMATASASGLIHKDEVIYRVPLMLSPTESPLAVDNETSLNGVISH